MNPPSALLARLRDLAALESSRLAVDGLGGSRTFGELHLRASRVAVALEARSLRGARVGIFSGPGAPWVEAAVGVLLAGGTAVALSPLYPPTELSSLVRASEPRAILASTDLEERALATFVGAPVLGVDRLTTPGSPGQGPAVTPRSKDPAFLLFTSGTTGKPKGAILTHENVFRLAESLGKAWGFSPSDVLLHTLPLHHLHGIGVSLVVALMAGATTRFLRFEPNDVWEDLRRATVLMGVPTQHKKLFDAWDAADPDRRRAWTEHGRALRLVTSGSAALPKPLGEQWRALSGAYPLERYGMTEIGIVLSNPLHGERRPGTVGTPLGGVTMRVVGEGAREVPPGEPGELWIRADTVFAGYDRNETATREAFSDGWFKTGDTVSVSDDGYVTILGRTSVDILKSGGYKLSALEIEEVLRQHDDVADAAVFGIPSPTWGDLVVAAIVPKPGRTVDEDALRNWAKERVAPYKIPKRIVVFEDLPRNALGKVQKSVLVELLTK